MPGSSRISVGRGAEGFGLRVAGQATMRVTPAVRAFAVEVLGDPAGARDGGDVGVALLTIDLSECSYLDSTFLGCLTELYRRYGHDEPRRVRFIIPDTAGCRPVLAATRLDTLLRPETGPAAPLNDERDLPAAEVTAEELGRLVLECHRRLVELGGPARETFAPVVDRLERDLDRHRMPGPSS
jgi:hypothetical protein